mmetsp:Transcript_40853/g.123090  ORF Transcript_40853/g.123090 Transcript_40853/m.123090 type:complete len:235 (+) Transcript_40853:2387-3091(+)
MRDHLRHSGACPRQRLRVWVPARLRAPASAGEAAGGGCDGASSPCGICGPSSSDHRRRRMNSARRQGWAGNQGKSHLRRPAGSTARRALHRALNARSTALRSPRPIRTRPGSSDCCSAGYGRTLRCCPETAATRLPPPHPSFRRRSLPCIRCRRHRSPPCRLRSSSRADPSAPSSRCPATPPYAAEPSYVISSPRGESPTPTAPTWCSREIRSERGPRGSARLPDRTSTRGQRR